MAFLSGWDKRIKFTIDKDKIDTADLAWFRVVVTLSSTQMEKVFAELVSDANRFKIAFVKADGTTELYGEIEKWDTANQKVIIHVSRDGWIISNTENIDFYMYYDIDHADNTDYIGDIDTAAGAAVWDGNFKLVTHMVGSGESAIDVGSVASDRNSLFDALYTIIDLANPADFTGKITNVAIYAAVSMVSAKVAIFRYVSANHYTAISVTGNLGAIAGGAARTFAVNLNVVVGDYIGIYFTAAGDFIEYSSTGGSGVMYLAGDQTACVNAEFAPYAGSISLYGTGMTVNILDSTSNNNDGTKKGVNEPNQATGKVGQGQDFDGVNDYISIADSADWTFGTGDLTIEALVNFTAFPASGVRMSIVSSSNAVNKSWGLNLYNNSGTLQWEFHSYDSAWTIDILENVVSLNLDTWHYVVVKRSGNSWYIYQDGAQCGTEDTNASAVVDVDANLYIGATCIGTWLTNGLIDEVHVVKGVARTAAWIKAEYNNLWDTLLTYGEEETGGTILEFFETLSIVDTMATSGTLAKAETLSIADTKVTSGSLGFIETLSIVDSWSGLLTFFETLSIADSKFLTGTLNLAETLGIVDSATFQCIKTFYETLSIIDSKVTSGSLSFAETLSIVDSWTVLKTFFETLSITDTVAMGGSLNVSEIISIIDSFIRWIEHPIYTEPAKVKPSYTEPTKVNVSYTEPAKSNPIYTKPAKSNPIYTEPTKGHPVYTEPTKKIKLD